MLGRFFSSPMKYRIKHNLFRINTGDRFCYNACCFPTVVLLFVLVNNNIFYIDLPG